MDILFSRWFRFETMSKMSLKHNGYAHLFNVSSWQNLVRWLRLRKEEGYTIVGVEQTSSSISIADLEFPAKVVLLLGKEKEGIPVEFLQSVDVCVEIPQLGIIRSLNVHVSGAISIWEYTKQMLQNWSTARFIGSLHRTQPNTSW